MATIFRTFSYRLWGIVFAIAFLTTVCAQNSPPDPAPAAGGSPAAVSPASPAAVTPPQQPPDKHVFGILPNYRTVDASLPFKPLTSKQKLTIAAKDSFDWSLVVVAAGYAGLAQMTDQYPRLGQGASGYANRFARAYADQVIGNMIVEGGLPVLLHEDPRYFRLGHGSFWGRTGYAASRVFRTRTDSGSWRFNTSEVLGNAIAVGISNSYYPGTRNIGDNSQRYVTQIGTDAFSNVLKEFWPDIRHRFLTRHPK